MFILSLLSQSWHDLHDSSSPFGSLSNLRGFSSYCAGSSSSPYGFQVQRKRLPSGSHKPLGSWFSSCSDAPVQGLGLGRCSSRLWTQPQYVVVPGLVALQHGDLPNHDLTCASTGRLWFQYPEPPGTLIGKLLTEEWQFLEGVAKRTQGFGAGGGVENWEQVLGNSTGN